MSTEQQVLWCGTPRYMYSNRITGASLPSGWSGMTSLKDFRLYSTPPGSSPLYQLTGSLPPEWSTMVKLEHLELYDNALTSGLPAQWSTMAKLQVMPPFCITRDYFCSVFLLRLLDVTLPA